MLYERLEFFVGHHQYSARIELVGHPGYLVESRLSGRTCSETIVTPIDPATDRIAQCPIDTPPSLEHCRDAPSRVEDARSNDGIRRAGRDTGVT
jgi:hypothetical protein